MPKYGSASKARLSSCHQDLQIIFSEVIKGVDCSILCGHRPEDEQQVAFEAGLSKLTFPDSKHNKVPSIAVDAAPYFSELRNTDWNDSNAFAFFAGYVMATANKLFEEGKISHKLRWGGDWDGDGQTKDQSFHDLPHFELIEA